MSESTHEDTQADLESALSRGEEWAVQEVRDMASRRARRFGSATREPADAEDATGEALVGVLELFRRGDYRRPLRNPRGFIHTRISRELMNWARRNRHRLHDEVCIEALGELVDAGPEGAGLGDAGELTPKELLQLVVFCLREAKPNWRIAWFLTRAPLDRSCTAVVLGATEGQVRNWVCNAQKVVDTCPEIQPYLARFQGE